MMHSYFIFRLLLFFIASSILISKDKSMNVWGSFGEGVNFMPSDSSFSLKMRVRFQSQANGRFNTEPDPRNLRTEAFIRRMRLRFEGFALTPSLLYKVQLNGSNEDNKIASGVSSTIKSTPVAASMARMLRPSLPMICPFISSDSKLNTVTVFSIATSAAVL